MGVEVPFRTPTSVLFFIITILAAYYAKQPDTVAGRCAPHNGHSTVSVTTLVNWVISLPSQNRPTLGKRNQLTESLDHAPARSTRGQSGPRPRRACVAGYRPSS